jgi:single-stranded-DNA-specific exonuclease
MVYKFCSYLDKLMNVTYADDLLDLVALGLIADMMDLRDYETKRLIDKGLNHIINPFIRTMINRDAFHFSNSITPIDIAFYIAPLVNAVTRVGT